MKKYKHLFFDLDHTLWDFEKNSAATLQILYNEFALQEKGIEPFEMFRKIYEGHNERLWERYRKGFIRREELRWKRMWHTLIDFKIGDEKLARSLSDVYLEHLPQQSLLLPFALEILQYCKDKGYSLHLITNGFEATQWQKMQHSGINHFFDEVITSEKSYSLKPHPDIFNYAIKAANASINESLMIGDTWEADIVGAKNFGIDQVYYNPSGLDQNEKATYEISCLSELKNIV